MLYIRASKPYITHLMSVEKKRLKAMRDNTVVIYQDDNGVTKVSVRFFEDDLWITQAQIKWSQAKLAEMVDISDSALSIIETGKCFPRLDNLIGISKALDMSVSFLFLIMKIYNMTFNKALEIFACLWYHNKCQVKHIRLIF